MDGFVGRLVIFKWDGNEVPGVREKSVELSGEPVDVTSDENGGWRRLLSGDAAENQVNISISGVTKSFGLKADWFSGDRMKEATFTYPDGGVITGDFFLASYSDSPTYNDATPFEASLQSSGPVEYTPPTGGTGT